MTRRAVGRTSARLRAGARQQRGDQRARGDPAGKRDQRRFAELCRRPGRGRRHRPRSRAGAAAVVAAGIVACCRLSVIATVSVWGLPCCGLRRFLAFCVCRLTPSTSLPARSSAARGRGTWRSPRPRRSRRAGRARDRVDRIFGEVGALLLGASQASLGERLGAEPVLKLVRACAISRARARSTSIRAAAISGVSVTARASVARRRTSRGRRRSPAKISMPTKPAGKRPDELAQAR